MFRVRIRVRVSVRVRIGSAAWDVLAGKRREGAFSANRCP